MPSTSIIDTYPEIAEQLKKLPEALRQALTKVNWDPALLQIARQHSLSVPQTQALHTETLLVLLGARTAQDFPLVIEDELDADTELVNSLVKNLNEKVFAPIHKEVVNYEHPDENNISHEQVLSELEQTTSPKDTSTGKSMVQKKLEKLFHIPKSESDHSITKEKKDAYTEGDPYHEPIS